MTLDNTPAADYYWPGHGFVIFLVRTALDQWMRDRISRQPPARTAGQAASA